MGLDPISSPDMTKRRSRAFRATACVAAAVAVAAAVLWALVGDGALFLVRFERGAAGGKTACRVEETRLSLRDGRSVPLRLYVPPGGYERVVLVIHGVHHGGYDEERLVFFAEKLVEAGFAVVTPELADLKAYEITERTVDDIAELARWTAASPLSLGSRRDRRIGLVGISFAGGLSISAAGRLDAASDPAFVLSFGGHGDLKRTMRFLALGERSSGGWRAPHIYGQAVEVRMFAKQLVPEADVAGLRDALLAYLENRRGDAERLSADLGDEGQRLVRSCLDGKSEELGPILAPLVERFDPAPALSPALSPRPRCPVYLLHGADDNVIPASETTALAAALQEGGEVHALVTDLIQHVELKRGGAEPPMSSYWRMARFWTGLLRE